MFEESEVVVRRGQLSLDVEPHPKVKAAMEDPDRSVFLTASLALKLDVPVHVNLNSGDRLIVSVADEDGELLARTYAEVWTATPTPIEDKTLGVIGMERIHKARMSD